MKVTCVICNKVDELPPDKVGEDQREKELILTRIWDIFIKYFYLVPSKWEDVSSFFIQKGQLPFCYNCFNKMRQLLECHDQLELVLLKVEALASNVTAMFRASTLEFYSSSNMNERTNGQPQIVNKRLQDLQQHIKQQINTRKTGLVKTFVCDGKSEFVQIGDIFQCSSCKIVKENFILMSQHIEDVHENVSLSQTLEIINNKDVNTNSKKRKLDNTTDNLIPDPPICVLKEEGFKDGTQSRPLQSSNENNSSSSSASSNVHLVNFTVEINRDDSEANVLGQVETLYNNPLECFYDESEEAQDFVEEEELEEGEIKNQRSHNNVSQHQPPKVQGRGVFKCHFPGCNKVFTSQKLYLYHEKEHVVTEPQFKCTVCNCSFVHEENFTLHTVKFHPELEFHPTTSTKTPNIIKSPSAASPPNSNLLVRRNIENPQTVTRQGAPFPCQMCSKSYWSETGLSIHKRTHKPSDTTTTTTATTITPTTNKTQQVQIVQNSSSSSSLTASQVKVIECSICLETFPLASSLQIHLRKVHNTRVNV